MALTGDCCSQHRELELLPKSRTWGLRVKAGTIMAQGNTKRGAVPGRNFKEETQLLAASALESE